MVSVLTFPGVNLNDVPAMLHALADQLASGEYGNIRGAGYAFITDTDELYCNLLGRVSQIEGVGLFIMASNMIQMVGDEE